MCGCCVQFPVGRGRLGRERCVAERWRCTSAGLRSESQEPQLVRVAEWVQQQERDMDWQPMLHWVQDQQQSPQEEVVDLSLTTKGLWAKFGALNLQDRVQLAWKELAKCKDR